MNIYSYVKGGPTSKTDFFGLGHCFYYITTGQMVCYSDLPNRPGYTGQMASGNEGKKGCKNNPDCIAEKGVGPLPTGSWYWDRAGVMGAKIKRKGGRVLVPVEVDASNRGDIRTHSCLNPFTNSMPYCSAGCITGTEATIKELNEFLDREWDDGVSNTLRVYE